MQNIAFATPSPETANPWEPPKTSSFQDLLLRPEFEARRLRFPVGQTWMRIVPAFRESAHGWLMPLHVLNFAGGRCNHPRTHKRSTRSSFDHAYSWMRQNHPEGLYSKTNKAGVRLLSDPMCLFWAIIQEENRYVARLFLASGYDGSRGGAPGLGYEVWRLTQERDEDNNLLADVVNPAEGRLISVEKSQPKGSRYPSYSLRCGRQPAPVDELLAKMEPEEREVLCPLERVVRELSEEEQWNCLGKLIAPQNLELIRAGVGHGA